MASLYTRLIAGRSEPTPRADEHEMTALEDVAVGRLIRAVDEERVASSSAALAEMMFGRQLRRMPQEWISAPVYGVVTPALVEACAPETVVQLAPGWAYAVAQECGARFFVIEIRALETGPWAGALGAGGEHLFDELLALIAQARAARITPVVLGAGSARALSPGSFTLRPAIDRLRALAPGQLIDSSDDAYAPEASPIFVSLASYAQAGVA